MPVETKSEFMARHGIPELSSDSRHWLFADGAMMAHSDFPECETRYEPPDDPRQRLEIVAAYWKQVLARIAAQLKHLKAVLNGQHPVFQWDSKLGPMPHGLDAPGMAAYLQQLAQGPKQKLEAAERELAALPTAVQDDERTRRLKRALAKRASQARDQLQKAMAVTI